MKWWHRSVMAMCLVAWFGTDVEVVWAQDKPKEPPKLGWSNSTDLSLVVTAGNSAAKTWGFSDELRHVWKDARFKFEVNVVRSDTAPRCGWPVRLARTLSALMGAVVVVVLMIACVNVGHFLLARGALRQREFAVRCALGVSRARLLRQLLTEVLVLAVAGTLCGVVFALWAGKLLERSLPLAAGIPP